MNDLTSLDDIAEKPKPPAGCAIALVVGFFGFITITIASWALFVTAAIKVLAS